MSWKIAPIGRGGNLLYSQADTPSLDLRFAENKSLTDYVSGQNLIDFTRASSATYVGSDGLIKTATTNLLLRSEEFNNAYWTNAGGGLVTPNATTAPDGTLTADMYTTTGSGQSIYPSGGTAVSPNTSYAFSVYVKLGTMAVDGYKIAFYDVTNTAFIAIDVVPAQVPTTDAWTRVVYTLTTPAGCTILRAYPFRNSATIPSSTVYFWGAQLEKSSTVGEYIPTTSSINSAPRFDHDPTTGESLGLLVEESRTNLLLRSEEFDQSPWIPTGMLAFGSGSTADATTAPDGTMTADLLTEDISTGAHEIRQTGSYQSGVTYTWSVFFKAASGARNLQIILSTGAFPGNPFVNVNPTTGEIINTSDINASVQPYPNGWYRASFSATADANSADNVFLRLLNGASTSYTGDGTSGIYLWGAQLEQGSFPTSYIKTEASAATRAADVASISGSNFSSWYRQDEGTVFAHFDTQTWNSDPAFPKVFTLSDGSDKNIWIGGNGTTDDVYQYRVRSGGVNYFGPADTARTRSSGNKAAIALSSNTALSVDGATAITASSVTVPSVIKLTIGADEVSGTNLHNNHISRLTYWPQRLSNTTLQTITQ